MLKIKLNDELKEIKEGTTLLDLLEADEKKKYYTALVNGRVRELTYVPKVDSEVKFCDLKYIESMKVYEATLRYVVAMAFYRLYPHYNIEITYNVSRSFFVESLDSHFKIDSGIIENIKKYIAELVEKDIPIERYEISKEEAIEIYKKYNQDDKLNLINYRTENYVNLYKCDDYYNYTHSYMLPSTGYLTKFKFIYYNNGIIVQYPRAELGGEIPKFNKSVVFARTLKQASDWNKIIDCNNIDKINRHIVSNNEMEFIQLCETKHNNMLAELGENIASDIDNIRLIAIAGPSSSGKTTFSNRLKIELMSRGITPVTLSIDNYYIDRDKVARQPDGTIDFEDINTLDLKLFNEHLSALISGEEIETPKFDFNTGKRVPGKKLKVPEKSPIIIEGIHALNELMSESIPSYQKYKIFIAPQIQINFDNHSPLNMTDLRLLRRIVRDKKFRYAPAEQTLGMWDSVRQGEFKWIYPNQELANYVYNSGLTYELCVLKKYAMPLLNEIGIDSPYYMTAKRLIRFLKNFKEIDESAIPCNSLIREFIGGSCFDV